MESFKLILAIVLSIGSTQGFIFGVILWKNSDWSQPQRYQAAFLLTLSYGLMIQVLRLFGIGYYDAMYHLTVDLSWSYGPLFYLFIKAHSTSNFRFTKADRIVLLPILIQAICSIYVRQQNFFWDGTRESLTWLGYWGYAYWMNYSTVPILASLLIVISAFSSLRLLKSIPPEELVPEHFTRVKRLVYVFGGYYFLVLVILVIDLVLHVLESSGYYFYFTRFFYYPFFIGEAILLYVFGITGILKQNIRILRPRKVLSADDHKQLRSLADQLKRAMEEEQMYHNPELTLSILAGQLQVKPYLITKTLNDYLQTSFTDFVNGYRVEEVKRLVKDPSNDKYTLLSIAHQAGFNSKSSFNRAVKKHLGISPNELKEF